MEFIVQTLLRGGTPTMATRHKEFASLCRKIMAMKTKVHEQKQRPVREESSVGTVESPMVAVEAHGANGSNANIGDMATAV